jgi:ATP-dependent DNA helicase RecG
MRIKTLLARGRGAMLEFLPELDAGRLAELIVSFANALGGTIVVGMDEQGRVYPGVAENLEPVFRRALQLCTPPFMAGDQPEYHAEETPEGQVAAIVIRPTPYQLMVEGRGTFVRSGKLNVRLSPEQALRGGRAAPLSSFEDQVIVGATAADFDEAVIEEYQRNRIKRGPTGESFTRTELLRDAGAIDPSGLPTVAGMLLFGKRPQQFLPQAGVLIVRFEGTSVREAARYAQRYARRVEIVGPAARMIERTWEVLFEEIHHQPRVEGLQRQETYDYPPEAVREALVNAICHRDYSIQGQRVEIRLFDDRMEIMSPGGLPGHITLENILDEHYSRNPRLVRGLYYWGYIEELGQGMDIIYDSMSRDHHPPPQLKDTGRNFTVTLFNAVDTAALEFGEDLNPRQMRALQFLAQHERITNSQYQQLCPEVTPETLRLDLKDLVERGILLRVGDKRGTYYIRKQLAR